MVHNYYIKESDSFDQSFYPNVVEELEALRKRASHIHTPFKPDIIITFLKEHRIQSNLLETNSEIVRLMTSGTLAVSHIESLFGACRQNVLFLSALEKFVRARLS